MDGRGRYGPAHLRIDKQGTKASVPERAGNCSGAVPQAKARSRE